jgi:hypothetical protein
MKSQINEDFTQQGKLVEVLKCLFFYFFSPPTEIDGHAPFFQAGKRKKSHDVRSGEHGG